MKKWACIFALGLATTSGAQTMNLKTLGATGSQQTMTCTTTASSSALTGCSGGDFAVGNFVYIQSAGIAPTVSTPSAPSVSCTSGNGGSCTGSVVYSYKIVGVQGFPNGTMTAPSAAASVTQAAQTPYYTSASTTPWVNTTVSWSAEASVSNWIIYKSVNGGPYNYYGITTNTALTDNGSNLSTAFNCTDDALPCVAPSTTTPNDVYAKITAISGGTYTIVGAGTNQPNYTDADGLPAYYPSIPSVSGSFTVQHDDSPAFVAAEKSLFADRGTQTSLYIPAGGYNVHGECGTGCEGGNGTVFSFAGLSNITVYGDGNATTINDSMDRNAYASTFLSALCGNSVYCTDYYAGENVGPGTNIYQLVDPEPAGSTSVTLSTPSNASYFPAGQWVTIFPSDKSSSACGRAVDLNLVLDSNATTGVVNLLYPLSRYYSASPPSPWPSSCLGPPLIAPVVNGLVANNITFKNFHFRGDVEFANYNVVDNLLFQDLWIQDNNTEDTGKNRHVTYLNDTIQEGGNQGPGNLMGIITGAYGDTDESAIGDTYTLTQAGGLLDAQTCGEGSANINFLNNTLLVTGIGPGQPTATEFGVWAIDDGCYNFEFRGNTVRVWDTAAIPYIIRADSATNPTIKNNDFFIDSVSQTAPASVVVGPFFALGGPAAVSDNSLVVGSGVPQKTFVGGNTQVLAGFQNSSVGSVSGSATGFLLYYGTANLLQADLTGNLTNVNIGSGRIAGLYTTLAFTQPASGGPYTLPAACTDSDWATGGDGLDCPNGPPVLNPTASSTTYINLFDDGTAVHFIGENYYAARPAVSCTLPDVLTAISAAGVATCSEPSNITGTAAAGLLTGTLATSAVPALAGDVTNSAGSLVTTVGQIRGAVVPVSAAAISTNSSGQLVAGLTTAKDALTADVAMTTAGTSYDGPTISIGAASTNTTYLVASTVTFKTSSTASAVNFVCSIYDGTTVFARGQTERPAIATAAATVLSLSLSAIVTETSTATLGMDCQADTASQTMAYETVYKPNPGASTIAALRAK